MSENDMSAPNNPYADWPLHHLLFVSVRDGGGPVQAAHGVAELHGITLDELKAHCRQAGDEWLARDGSLTEINQPVYDWAKR